MPASPWVVETAALPAAAALAGADFLRLGQSGVSKKLTITALLASLAISTLAAGTLTTSQPMTLTQTWNAAVDFVGLSVDITSTSSNAASQVFRTKVGANAVFSVRKDGALDLYAGNTNPVIASLSGYMAYMNQTGGNGVMFGPNATGTSSMWGAFTTTTFQLRSTFPLAWASSTDPSASADLFLYRDAANTLAQRNGTTAQTLNVYGTWTDSSNYVRASLTIDTASLILDAQGAGLGSPQQFLIRVKGQDYLVGNNNSGLLIFSSGTTTTTQRWQISATGHFLAIADNTYDIGAAGATRFRTAYAGTSFIGPAGSASVPSFGLSGYVNTGMYLYTANTIGFTCGGAESYRLTSAQLSLSSWMGGGGSKTLTGYRDGGNADRAGDNLVIDPGYGSGNATAGAVIIQAPTPAAGSGTTAQTLIEIARFKSLSGGTTPMMMLGGATSSFPALKRSTTSIQVRLADDSAFTFVQGKHRTEANAVSEAITPTHSLTMWDAGGTAYKVAVQAA